MMRVTRARLAACAVCAALAASALALPAAATAGDAAATGSYLRADHAILRTIVGGWSRVEGAIGRLDSKLAAECPHVGAGAPQNEEAQKFSLETAGALWSAAYHANAAAIRRFVATVSRLRWSNGAVERAARQLAKGLGEMITLPVPPLCSDVRAWAADGFGAAPADVSAYARRAEGLEVQQIPWRLLRGSLSSSDRGLAASDERLNKRFEELEFVRGQDQWNKLLELLSLNQ